MTQNTKKKSENIRAELPQIFAALAAALSDTSVGIALAFSAILIPQVLQEQVNQNENAIQITKEESTYIASLVTLITIPSAFLGGFIMDALGRTAVLKLGAIPSIIGWILVAISSNKWMLLSGRCLSGTVGGLATMSILVYISETSTPKYRGALLALGPLSVSLGMFLVYIVGALMHWRTFAWVCVGYTLIPLALSLMIPESPPWLVSKNRINEAKNSLQWSKKYYYNAEAEVENELSSLLEDSAIKKNEHVQSNRIKMLAQPSVYKPLLIVTGLWIIQQFSGSYIMLLYSVTFMENVGTKINPYLGSILIGGMRFGMSLVTVWLLRYFKRRSLLISGLGGMAFSVSVSALYTSWIQAGTTTHNWVPVVMIPLFILFAMISVLSIPFTFTGELFPLAARGVSQSICFMVLHAVMFIALENYYTLNKMFGGASGIQYFFATVSLLGVVYCYVFVPETHGKKLSEIEEYFDKHTTYLSVVPEKEELLKEKQKPLKVINY